MIQELKKKRDEALNDLNLLRAKFYKASLDGKFREAEKSEGDSESQQDDRPIEEDLDLETAVDPLAFEALKATRNKYK